ncbi:hypothetical protein NL676_011346 [Syzygium grande]|nr:hypothetical protein NL676_011346 [Syzygium grande]
MPIPTAASRAGEGRVFKTKLIQFLGRSTRIILQDENGPCPLVAICNILLLRNVLKLSTAEVSQETLLSWVTQRLIDSNSNNTNRDAGYVENLQRNMADAFELLPHLATGIDVDIKFRRIRDFVPTGECAIFDLLDISLCHGCIVDPQDRDIAMAIGSKSYNALTHELVARELRVPQQRKLVQKFLESSAGRLTNYGLSCLQRDVNERELCVFFDNEHFSTMFKYEGRLYLLATDEGFLDQRDHVWEKLEKVNRDNVYVSSDFKEYEIVSHTNDTWDEHNAMASTDDYVASIDNATLAGLNTDFDRQLAIALQQEEWE